MVGQCTDGGHQGEIEELRLTLPLTSVNSSSIIALAPALRRLKVIQFVTYEAFALHDIGELSGIAADCDTLEEFGFQPGLVSSNEHFKAICQLLPKFPSLKRVTQQPASYGIHLVDKVDSWRSWKWSKQARLLNKPPRSNAAMLKRKLP
jgi:hypothetical protein